MCLEEWQKWLGQKKVTQSTGIVEIVLVKCKVKKVSQWVIILKCLYLRTVRSNSHAPGTNNIAEKQSILTPPYSLVILPHPDPQSSNYMKSHKHWDTFLSHCMTPCKPPRYPHSDLNMWEAQLIVRALGPFTSQFVVSIMRCKAVFNASRRIKRWTNRWSIVRTIWYGRQKLCLAIHSSWTSHNSCENIRHVVLVHGTSNCWAFEIWIVVVKWNPQGRGPVAQNQFGPGEWKLKQWSLNYYHYIIIGGLKIVHYRIFPCISRHPWWAWFTTCACFELSVQISYL
jgi:hypothetical protein